MILPNSPANYDAFYQNSLNRELQDADALNHKRDQTVEIGRGRLVLTSANGTRYHLTVDNTGNLTTTVVTT